MQFNLAKKIGLCIMPTEFGDVAELVECARLEIAYTGNCIGGSNPSISARKLHHFNTQSNRHE